MATDMGGFAQAGGPAFVDRFGRPLSGQINPIVGAQRTDFVTASGGETSIILGANPIAGSVAVFVNGALVSPSSISGVSISLPSALSVGNVVGIIYRTFDPNPRNAIVSAYSALAVSIYSKLACWWALTEVGGTTFADSHTGGFNLATYGSPAMGQAAIRGGGGASAKFVASSAAYNNCGTSAPVQNNTNAVFCWIKTPSAFNSPSSIIYSDYSTTASWTNGFIRFYLSNSGLPCALWVQGSTATSYSVSAPAGNLALSTGYFLGYCRDGTAMQVTNYRNATADTPVSYSTNITGGAGSDFQLSVGGFQSRLGYSMLGWLQDVTLFTTTLTSAEVSYLYNGGNGYSYAQLKANAGH